MASMASATPLQVFYILGAMVMVIYLITRSRLSKRMHLPPRPPILLSYTSLHLLVTSPIHHYLAKMAKKYGPLMYFQLGQKQCIVASSPAMAMEFLKHQDANFSSRPALRVGEICLFKDILFQDTTPTWRHLRKIFQMKLTSAKQFTVSQHAREEEMAHMLCAIPHNRDVEVRPHVSFMFSNIIARMVLNKRFITKGLLNHEQTDMGMLELDPSNSLEIQEAHNFREIVEGLSWCLGAVNPGDFIPALKWMDVQLGFETKLQKQRERMDVFASKIISEHLEQQGLVIEEEKDMVDVMLDEMGEKDGYEITLDHVKGVLWDAFAAGTDTPSVAVEWAMSELVRHPEIMKKAQAELDVVVGCDRLVHELDIPKLSYIQAIAKESLRLHPPVPMLAPHMSTMATKALGYDIPANSWLVVNIWAIGRDESIWEKPLEFIPERFLEGNNPQASVDLQGQHYELLPFGSGRRACPGMALGTVLVQMCIANLLHAFDWSPPSGRQIDDIDMSEGLRLKGKFVPLLAHAKARLSSHLYERD